MIEFSVFISLSSVRNYLTLAGITRQRIRRIAAQRFTQENLDYANYFMNKINDYTHICWFDESGISQRGMQSRNNVGLGIRGSGGAYIREALRYPPKNLSVLGLIDKNGMFAVESFDGGTDTIRVDQYFQRHAVMMQARGVDCVVIDNCPSHRIASIAFWLQLVGIEVLFLPRYWPQWNPIEVRLVVLLLCCCCVVVVWWIVFWLRFPPPHSWPGMTWKTTSPPTVLNYAIGPVNALKMHFWTYQRNDATIGFVSVVYTDKGAITIDLFCTRKFIRFSFCACHCCLHF